MHTLVSAEAQHGDGEAAHRICAGVAEALGCEGAVIIGSRSRVTDRGATRAKPVLKPAGRPTKTAGGVDAYATKAHLLDVARRLDVTGRSRLTKAELVTTIDKADQRGDLEGGQQTPTSRTRSTAASRTVCDSAGRRAFRTLPAGLHGGRLRRRRCRTGRPSRSTAASHAIWPGITARHVLYRRVLSVRSAGRLCSLPAYQTEGPTGQARPMFLALLHTIEIKGSTRRVVYADDRLGGSTPTLPTQRCQRSAADRLRVTAHVSRMRWRRFGGRATAAGFWQRAHAWFAAHGITIERALTDNGACHCSRLWLAALADTGVTPKPPAPTGPGPTGRWSASTGSPSRELSTSRSQ